MSHKELFSVLIHRLKVALGSLFLILLEEYFLGPRAGVPAGSVLIVGILVSAAITAILVLVNTWELFLAGLVQLLLCQSVA